MEIKKMKLFKLETYNKKIKLKNLLKNFDDNKKTIIIKHKNKKATQFTIFKESKQDFLNYTKQHNIKIKLFHDSEICIFDCLL